MKRRNLFGHAVIGAVVGVTLSLIVGCVEAAGLVSMVPIEPWRPVVWWREDWREWRNFYVLGIGSGAVIGILWARLAVRPVTPEVSAADRPGRRFLRKPVLGVILLLAVIAASFVMQPVRYAAVGRCRGEKFYHGRPASLWIDQLKSACQPVKVPADQQGLVAIFGGMAVDGLIKIVAEDIKQDAVPDLVAMLRDPNPTARFVAATTVYRIGPEAADATPALIDAVSNDQDAKVRLRAALALVAIGQGAKNAVPTLLQAMKDDNLMATNRWEAGEALGELGPEAKEAVPDLIELIRTNDLQQRLALKILKKIDPEAAAKLAAK